MKEEIIELRGEAQTKIADLLIEELDIDGNASHRIAERVCNIVETYCDVPTGIVEILATVRKYGVESERDKSIAIQLYACNTQENRVKLALIGDSTISLRMLQGDIEAVNATDNPNQMDIEEANDDDESD